MPNVIWWILGIAVAGGTAFIYSESGKKIFWKDACIKDLPEPKKTEVLDAIKAKDVNKLNSFANQAEAKGWKCAANEIRENVNLISSEKPKCPTDAQVDIAVKDIISGKLSLDGAAKLVSTLDKSGCVAQKDLIDKAVTEKRKDGLLLSKDLVTALAIGEIKESLKSLPEADKVEIIDMIQQSKSSGVDYSNFKYTSGKVLAYADEAAKFGAAKAESLLREIANKINSAKTSSDTKSTFSANAERAKADWPAIMSLPSNDLGIHAQSAALCVKKFGAPYPLLTTGDGETVKSTPVVHLRQAIPGCAINVDKLVDTANQLESKYGSTFSEAVAEIRLITNSLKKDLLE